MRSPSLAHSEVDLRPLSLNITSNGSYTYQPTGFDGFDRVTTVVNVPTSTNDNDIIGIQIFRNLTNFPNVVYDTIPVDNNWSRATNDFAMTLTYQDILVVFSWDKENFPQGDIRNMYITRAQPGQANKYIIHTGEYYYKLVNANGFGQNPQYSIIRTDNDLFQVSHIVAAVYDVFPLYLDVEDLPNTWWT